MTNKELGQFGENLAAGFLIKNGYTILTQNFYFKKNEVDIIAQFDDLLVIVEVKTRNTAEIGQPFKAVTRTKQKQIIKTANYYIQQNELDQNVRFDIISIVHNSYRTEIEHIPDAFFPLL